VSNDGMPDDVQWRIGQSALLAYSLGVIPFKDNWWSGVYQPQNSSQYQYCNFTEPNVVLQSAVASLSAGAVAPGDGLGYSNKTLIMYTCREDGLLLKPDYPLSSTDSWYQSQAYSSTKPKWELMTTQTTIQSTYTWMYVVGVEIAEKMSLTPGQLHFPTMLPPSVTSFVSLLSNGDVTDWSSVSPFNASLPLVLPSSRLPSFSYCVISPVFTNQIILFGEAKKWSKISKQRILGIDVDDSSITVLIQGSSGEAVTMDYAVSGFTHQSASCQVGPSGHVTLVIYAGGQSPSCLLNNQIVAEISS